MDTMSSCRAAFLGLLSQWRLPHGLHGKHALSKQGRSCIATYEKDGIGMHRQYSVHADLYDHDKIFARNMLSSRLFYQASPYLL